MKIGDKEFKPFYNNRSIYEIEEAFNDTPISKIMLDVESFTTKKLGKIIWHGIKADMTWDEFVDSIELSQYEPAGKECGEALGNAFKVKKK